jgi:hypothetical protein|tara:strand:+ start:212 stop:526 length:315 start_codon:yes stop_codon:yes gene_type:complete
MSRISFTQLTTGNAATDQVQGYIATALNPLFQLPFASGNRVQDVDITTADTIVDHGLEQAPEGWIILKQNAAQVIYESATVNDFPATTVILKAGGTVTADLFFF